MTISHLLLDIEGTTCPVSFVAETLFPYAAKSLRPYVEKHRGEPELEHLIEGAEKALTEDTGPEAQQLLSRRVVDATTGKGPKADVVDYLQLLIQQDRKLSELKELQGLIWQAGYASKELIAPLFADVPDVLQKWHKQGKILAVYSSGSVTAQKLLYGHSESGDLGHLFSHWFDTRIGQKQVTESYLKIAAEMKVDAMCILFLSDSLAECEAAHRAGMEVYFSDRDGNPARDPGPFRKIGSLGELELEP
ncbi:acireductone synthase [Cyanobium sp. WAJ14-Wanaka]|uniref:acireductone synthase n=1 Tax=Cyanobium sp. WAJ14-Wanaka TaxID=2823725 RepID=UPI0020CCBEFA|nr:acireductone synthase [Cyanobium sp. WAJ14-Wanaka]MCP9773973.1 acireductone synthase [Cyanobium sp. WAJ14-Wanaka]